VFKKSAVAGWVLLAVVLLVAATFLYPGGSNADAHSVGFSWRDNYLTNLLSPQAVDGRANPARPWAVLGLMLLCGSCALAFVRFARKVDSPSARVIIGVCGSGAMLFVLLAAAPYHDHALTVADVLGLLALFYTTVILWRAKQHIAKFVALSCIVLAYTCTYVYYARMFVSALPILQKLWLASVMALALSLEYGVDKIDQ
jgi:hypothetical protein